MSNLTTEQISELHDLALARLSEFDSVAAHFPKLVPGVVRIVVQVYEEWRAEQEEGGAADVQPPRFMPPTIVDAYTNGASQPVVLPGGVWPNTNDIGINAGDYAEFEAVWPSIPDLQGEDVFAAEHGQPTGEPEADTGLWAGSVNLPADIVGQAFGGDDGDITDAIPTGLHVVEPPPVIAPLPEPVRVPVLSPRAAATLGPEHTAVTPPRPIGRDRAPDVVAINKPRPLSVVDAEAKRQAELAEIVAHLQRIAKGKRLPSMTDYHGTRPKHLPMWPTMQSRHNLSSWSDMAALTGLEYGKRHLRVADDEPEIDPDPDADDLDDDAADGDDAPATKRKRPNGTRIKHPRKMGYEYGAESKPGRKAQAPETLAELIKAVQGMAMAGVMPTQSQFDTAKPVVWPRATSLMTRFNMSWEQLREMAGLKPNPRWGATWQQADAAA